MSERDTSDWPGLGRNSRRRLAAHTTGGRSRRILLALGLLLPAVLAWALLAGAVAAALG